MIDMEVVRGHQLAMARQDADALADLASRGVRFGEPVEPNASGCESCIWHIENVTDPHRGDGGTASAIRSWALEGHLGNVGQLVLHPVKRATT